MRLTRIDSTNARQPSWQIVKEWDEMIAKELQLPIRKDCRPIRWIKSRLNEHGLSWIYRALFINTNLNLRFIMGADTKKVCDVNKYTIPVIIDFWLQDKDLKGFYESYSHAPLVLLTNKEAYDFLKAHDCPLPIEHWPLSFPDQYALSKEVLTRKDYEFTIIGRPNPFFVRLLDEYCKRHSDFEYIMNNGDIDHREYVTNRGRFIAKDTGRKSYLDVIRRTKISCYSTPGVDEGKHGSNGYNQVTPRLFEMLCNGCQVIGHYPQNGADVEWYGLNSVIPNVNTYEEFEATLDKLRKTQFDYEKVDIFMKKHYTSQRAMSLRQILDKHNIKIGR